MLSMFRKEFKFRVDIVKMRDRSDHLIGGSISGAECEKRNFCIFAFSLFPEKRDLEYSSLSSFIPSTSANIRAASSVKF